MRHFSIPILISAFIISLFTLSACGDKDPAVKIYAPDEAGITECQTDHPEQAEQCKAALSGSEKEHEETAQHYTLDACMAQYGASACLPRHGPDGDFFVPAMAGFMFGLAVSGGPVIYHPVYVNLNGQAYYGRTSLGTYRAGRVAYITPAPNATWTRTYAVRTVSIPHSTPVSPPSYNYGSPRIEHGGLGGSRAVTRSAPPSMPHTASAPPSISRGGLGSSGGARKR